MIDRGAPVAVGGLGGSGTRVVATLLQALGYYLGDALNEFLDNAWFALLFKQRSILMTSESAFARRVEIFQARMSGARPLSSAERNWTAALGEYERLQQPQEWRAAMAASLLDGPSSRQDGQPWGWKEPNTHIIIDRLLAAMPQLRYIHVVRDPLYMSGSSNQNQLAFWGPLLLDRAVEIEPRESLSYWCAADRRIIEISREFSGRILAVDYDELCTRPIFQIGRIAGFLNVAVNESRLLDFIDTIDHRRSRDRLGEIDLQQFDPADLAYIAERGYLK